MKTCNTCREIKELTAFSPKQAAKDKLEYSCRDCRNAKKRAVRASKLSPSTEAFKMVDRLVRRARYIKSRPAYIKEYRFNNLDRLKEKAKEFFSRPENKEKQRLRKIAYIAKNPHMIAMNGAKRRKMKKVCTPKFRDAEWDNFLMSEMYFLRDLRNKVTGIEWNVDHIVPLLSKFVCGLHYGGNMRVITKKENLAKSNVFWEGMWE